MTTGQKLAVLRREKGYTQEELADILGVSRQAISKWESDITYPETEKLIRLSSLYDCSMDYLLKEEEEEKKPKAEENPESKVGKAVLSYLNGFRYRSKRKIGSLPLVDIDLTLKGEAKGVVAIGIKAKGIISIGVLSMGILSIGTLSFGLISLGCLVLGLLSIGAISLGVFALGAIAIGIYALGAISIGISSIGALAIGYEYAYGDYAYSSKLAIFDTYGSAPIMLSCKEDVFTLRNMVDNCVPGWLSWFCRLPL